jgi:hypothetical protein
MKMDYNGLLDVFVFALGYCCNVLLSHWNLVAHATTTRAQMGKKRRHIHVSTTNFKSGKKNVKNLLA